VGHSATHPCRYRYKVPAQAVHIISEVQVRHGNMQLEHFVEFAK
jgi:hypothetical protein